MTEQSPRSRLEEAVDSFVARTAAGWSPPWPRFTRHYESPIPPETSLQLLSKFGPRIELGRPHQHVTVRWEGDNIWLEIGSTLDQRLHGSTRWQARLEVTRSPSGGTTIVLHRRLLIRLHVLLVFTFLISCAGALLRIDPVLLDVQEAKDRSPMNLTSALLFGFPIVLALDVAFYLIELVGDIYAPFLRRELQATRR